MQHIDERLLEWATDREREIIAEIERWGSGAEAARQLGMSKGSVNGAVKRVKDRAAKAGYSPDHDMTRTVPEGYSVRGVSTYYDAEGKPRGQWVKSRADDVAREAAMRAAYEAMAEELPRVAPTPAPAETESALCNLYTLTDCHVGMLAWGQETGDDWDLKIAEETLTRCFERSVEASPPARVAVVNQLGDWNHWDGLAPVTPTSGHMLDADGRFSKMVATSIRILRRIVDYALARHDEVHLIVAEGNHDLASSVWLRLMFTALYENEPRIKVNDSELPYYVFQHGKTMLAFHHGHMAKNGSLPLLFASQYPDAWGATRKRYAHTGHRHHVEIKEHSGMTVCQHSTLAARDAYAARGGWFSERQITAYTYHSEWGQVGSNTIVPEMVV